MLKRIIGIILCIALLTSPISLTACSVWSGSDEAFTLMIYMVGSDNILIHSIEYRDDESTEISGKS